MKKPKRTSLTSRKSSVTNAMVHSIIYVEDIVGANYSDWLARFNQKENNEKCIYCGSSANSFDHIFNLVRNGSPTGYMTEKNNLVPCCSNCNSKKSGKNWEDFIESDYFKSFAGWEKRHDFLRRVIEQYQPLKIDFKVDMPNEFDEFQKLRSKLLEQMDEIERALNEIRKKVNNQYRSKIGN